MTCDCQYTDAWRCAVDRRLPAVACPCACHRELATADQFAIDVALLNDNSVHIVTTRDAQGRRAELSRETIHALAEVVRCFLRSAQ